MTEELDFSKICRVCCLSGTLLSLFKVHLNRKLMACTNINIWRDDGMPNHICSKCVSKLHIAYQFKKTCEKSDAKLRNYLENVIANKPTCEEQRDILTEAKGLQEIPSSQSSIPIQNSFVYIECNPNVSTSINTLQDVNKQFNNGMTPLLATPIATNALTYNLNPMNVIDGITNGFSIQHLNVPTAVQYQAYSVPLQITHPNGIVQPITQQQIATVSSVPCQPISNNNKQIVTSEASINNAARPLEDSQPKNIPFTKTAKDNDSKMCQTCGKVFPTSIKLSRHIKTHSLTFTHRCKICHKGFTHGGNFKVHMRMHNDERPFSCTICDHRCRQLQDLEKHKRKHNGEKPYICRYCSKAFSTSSNLISHERIHTSEKPYVCSICQKAFCQSNELTKHFRTHTHEKSHECKICKKGFNGSSTLIIHMRTHSGEKPYICKYCNRGFTQSSCLKMHLKRHKEEDKNFQCEQCPRTYISNSGLKEHIKLDHNTDENVYESIK